MSLKLMYITNRPEVAQIAEAAGVDRIFVDMEYIGKTDRQGGMDTVQSHHTLEDIKKIADAIEKAELLVRVNPIHDDSDTYLSSKDEIDSAIKNGAQILMLPYFKTIDEVKKFERYVNKRAKVMLLVETKEAVSIIDEVLERDIDEIFIGLNDLSLSYKKKFMFELLTDGTVEDLCYKFKKRRIPYGFGGIAALGKGLLPAEMVITEHYRLGSTSAILSRSFCNTSKISNIGAISATFMNGVREIRNYEKSVSIYSEYFENNLANIVKAVNKICNQNEIL